MSRGWKKAALGLIAAALVAALAGTPAYGAQAPVPVCGSPAGKTLAMGAHARVHSLPFRGPRAEKHPEGVRLIGCLPETEKFLQMGTNIDTFSGPSPVDLPVNPDAAAVSAPLAAYSTTFNGIDFNYAYAIVRNLSTGEVLQVAEADPRGGVEQSTTVTDLALRGSGTVAWISQGVFVAGGGFAHTAEVAFAVPGQEAVTLDENKTIGLHSLEIHGGRVTWLDGGVRHSAEMP